jgi:hypothetical protein
VEILLLEWVDTLRRELISVKEEGRGLIFELSLTGLESANELEVLEQLVILESVFKVGGQVRKATCVVMDVGYGRNVPQIPFHDSQPVSFCDGWLIL